MTDKTLTVDSRPPFPVVVLGLEHLAATPYPMMRLYLVIAHVTLQQSAMHVHGFAPPGIRVHKEKIVARRFGRTDMCGELFGHRSRLYRRYATTVRR